MFPPFLPSEVNQLTESTSIELARLIQCQPLATPLSQNPICTTYVQAGKGGAPLLLVHGFDSSLLEFRRLLPLLASQQETWTLDLLGFGFTERAEGLPYSPTAIKTHLHSFWGHNIHRPVILIGASMGGAVAIDFALTYPDCVAQLVLLDSAGFEASPVPQKLMVPPIDAWATAFLGNPSVRRWTSRQAYFDRSFVTPDAELCASLHLKHPRWQPALIAFAKSGGYNFLQNKIAEVAQPTLILWGRNDRIVNPQNAHKFEQAIAQSQLIWISECGHVPHLEQPQITAQHIRTWQNQVPIRSTQTMPLQSQ